jgi:hypothetical protein
MAKATTPAKKVTDGKQKHSHVDYAEEPPYFGYPETLKSGGARCDDIPTTDRETLVSGSAPQPDMTKDFVAGHDGWPKKVRP